MTGVVTDQNGEPLEGGLRGTSAFSLDSWFGSTQGFDIYDDSYGTHGPLGFAFVVRKAEVVVDSALAKLFSDINEK